MQITLRKGLEPVNKAEE